MLGERDIQKLRAIGYSVERHDIGQGRTWWSTAPPSDSVNYHDSEAEAWAACKAHAKGPGLKATMADKVRWLVHHCHDSRLAALFDGVSPGLDFNPEAAVDALFWAVP